MTTNSTHPAIASRVMNGLIALALAAFLLGAYWPIVQLTGLSRAELDYQGVWIGGNARQVVAVKPGGPADRAGIKPGDVFRFDPARNDDWILAGYRQMPEGFSASLPVRHASGATTVVRLEPTRVSYSTTLNDRLALIARLCAHTIALLLGLFLVWARPGVMAWSFFAATIYVFPVRPWIEFALAFNDGHWLRLLPAMALCSGMAFAFIPFALSFPRNSMTGWPRWSRALGLLVVLVWLSFCVSSLKVEPFMFDRPARSLVLAWAMVAFLSDTAALIILWRTYRRSGGDEAARLKWAVLGMSAALAAVLSSFAFFPVPSLSSSPLSGETYTLYNWAAALIAGFLLPLAMGNAILRQRVIDAQFAVSRTLVYGTVSTLALAVVATVHWLLGRMIEHSGLALGLEGAAAIGVGLVLHRGTHTINELVDRVVFRKHHAAEERLRRVTAALPFATEQRSIAEALVLEPVRNLNLASAALFYRETGEGPLRRVLAHGWSDAHAESLDADSLLVRYLQAEHEPLKLDDPQLLPAGVPAGAALPVLAMPIVNQHALIAMVLYGGHANSTLLDPDEIELLHRLAKAAATSHSQVRIATLARENAALTAENSALARDKETEKTLIDRLEAKLDRLAPEAPGR